jgi:hypothetical protein
VTIELELELEAIRMRSSWVRSAERTVAWSWKETLTGAVPFLTLPLVWPPEEVCSRINSRVLPTHVAVR